MIVYGVSVGHAQYDKSAMCGTSLSPFTIIFVTAGFNSIVALEIVSDKCQFIYTYSRLTLCNPFTPSCFTYSTPRGSFGSYSIFTGNVFSSSDTLFISTTMLISGFINPTFTSCPVYSNALALLKLELAIKNSWMFSLFFSATVSIVSPSWTDYVDWVDVVP